MTKLSVKDDDDEQGYLFFCTRLDGMLDKVVVNVDYFDAFVICTFSLLLLITMNE